MQINATLARGFPLAGPPLTIVVDEIDHAAYYHNRGPGIWRDGRFHAGPGRCLVFARGIGVP